jgi:hypothetical protein
MAPLLAPAVQEKKHIAARDPRGFLQGLTDGKAPLNDDTRFPRTLTDGSIVDPTTA